MTIEEEINHYFTLIDCYSLIDSMGFEGFLIELFRDKKERVLTPEEREAVALLTKGWNNK